jgi:hypothetical protein
VADVLESDVEQKADVGVVERVVDVTTLLSVPHKPPGTKKAQVMRARRLGQARHGREIAHA